MTWPWQRRTEEPENVERRSTTSATDRYVAAALAYASGSTSAADPALTCAAEIAANLYGRSLSAAAVTPKNSITASANPALLADIGRRLLLRGEYVALVQVELGLVTITPACDFDVTGSYDRRSWRYRLHLPGPTATTIRTASAESVLHIQYSIDATSPHRGVSPLQGAGLTSAVLANLERSLGEEAGTPTGAVLPMPAPASQQGTDAEIDAGTDPSATLASDLQRMNGNLVLTETVSGGYGDPSQAPQRDLRPSRFGPEFTDAEVRLRNDVAASVLSAAGVPVALFSTSDGTAAREGLSADSNMPHLVAARFVGADRTPGCSAGA